MVRRAVPVPDATRNGRATAAADIDRAAAAGRARSLIGTMATAPALSVQSANISDVDACVTEAFIVVEGTASGCTVAGHAEARIAHPWPRDPSSSDVFAQWRWDGAALTVHNDRWGFQPIFYVASKNRIAVSPSIHVLLRLGAPVDLDDEALAVFLRLSHFSGPTHPSGRYGRCRVPVV